MCFRTLLFFLPPGGCFPAAGRWQQLSLVEQLANEGCHARLVLWFQ
jgi:hypothetical protein